MPNMICPNCREEFYNRDSKTKYCSKECYKFHRYGNKTTANCLTCNKEISYYKVFRKFCSSSCSATHNNKTRVLTKRWTIKKARKERKCVQCGILITTRAKTFCGTQCSADHRNDAKVSLWLEDWTTGSCKNGVTKQFVKRYVKEQANHQCQICSQSDTHNGKPLTLQIDHIDGDWRNNKAENLRVVCPNCHTQTENYGSKNKSGNGRKHNRRKL